VHPATAGMAHAHGPGCRGIRKMDVQHIIAMVKIMDIQIISIAESAILHQKVFSSVLFINKHLLFK
jgi:hypothetical protein